MLSWGAEISMIFCPFQRTSEMTATVNVRLNPIFVRRFGFNGDPIIATPELANGTPNALACSHTLHATPT